MVHLPPLPGAPGNTMSMREVTEFALSEADKLETAGVDACIVENVGDVPLFKENLPPTASPPWPPSPRPSSGARR